MPRPSLLVLAALTLCGFSAVTFGCGGGGNSSQSSAFRGTYNGTFSLMQTGNTQTGTLTGTVANNGAFSGSQTNIQQGTVATVTGTFAANGQTTLTITYPDATYTATGISAVGVGGHLFSNLTQTQGTTSIGPLTLDLTPQ